MKKDDPFPDIIGQESVKRQLGFFIKGYNAFQEGKGNAPPPHLLFTAPKGCGKTTIAKAFGRNLVPNGMSKHKPLLEINCATIRTLRQFFNSVVIPNLIERDVTVLLDEASELPRDVVMAMLTILNPNPNHSNSFSYEDYDVVFDFKRLTFIVCTTEGQSLFDPFVDRFWRIGLEEYSMSNLADIVRMGLSKGVKVDKKTGLEIATVLRGNARSAQKMASNINQYCSFSNIKKFTVDHWNKLTNTLGISPLGLLPDERRVLNELCKVKEMRLTQLASKLGLTRQSVQYDLELFLQKMNLIGITTGGRYLTKGGHQYLKNVNA
tara:strand:- start:5438 stop:6403 length:966 start_codon:yes stop_codon:yes gene_type:complete